MPTRFLAGPLAAILLVARLWAAPIAIEVPSRTEAINFETEVLPVLRANCLACHNKLKSEAHLVLETPDTIRAGGDSGAAVVAGKSGESLLLLVAAHQQESFMPPAENAVGAKPLTPKELGLIKLWIDQGATGTVSASRNPRFQPLPASHQPIFATAVTPDGQFAACTRGNQLTIYHVPTGKLAARLVDPDLQTMHHRDVIRSLAFDPVGEVLASGAFREVKLWRRPSITKQAEWLHDAEVTTITVSRDGRLAATGDMSGRVRVWVIATNKVSDATFAERKAPITGLAFSPDITTLYTSHDKSIQVSNTADGGAIGKPIDAAAAVNALVTLREGQWLAAAGADGVVRIYETKSLGGEESKPLKEIKAHTGAVLALASTDKPDDFLSGGEDGLVRRFNAESGQSLREVRHDAPITSVAFAVGQGRALSPFPRFASAGGGRIKLWNAENGQLVAELLDPRPAKKMAEVEAELAFAKTGLDLARGEIKSYEGPERIVGVRAMDIKKAEEELVKLQKTLEEKKQAIEKAKEDPKKLAESESQVKEAETAVLVGNTIIERAKIIHERAKLELEQALKDAAVREERVKQLEGQKAEAMAAKTNAKPNLRSVAFFANGQRLVAGGDDGALHCFTAEEGSPTQTWGGGDRGPGTGEQVGAMAITSSGKLIAGTDKRAIVFSSPADWQLQRTISGDLVDRVLALDFSRDGKQFATGGGVASRSGELKVWNAETGGLVREIKEAHADTVFAVRFSPDGKHLASAGADRLVNVFNAATGERERSFAGHTAHVLSVGWKGDGKLLVSAGTDQAIKLWDFENSLPLRSFKGNTYQIGPYRREITSAQFIGSSEQILATSGDGTVRLHRITTDNDILTFTGTKGYQYSAAATPDGQTILVGGSDGLLRRYRGHERDVKQTFGAE